MGKDPMGYEDVRWDAADGQTNDYSRVSQLVDIVALADRIVGPEDKLPVESVELLNQSSSTNSTDRTATWLNVACS